jgi:hypothetical protein
MRANEWAKAFRNDTEPEPHRWNNSHCLIGAKSGTPCGADLSIALIRQPDKGRWIYFAPVCGHTAWRSRAWLTALLP